MKISVLCSSEDHPVNNHLYKWGKYDELCRKKEDLTDGDILFLISCMEIVGKEIRDKFKNTIVIHASDLPKGRGWSPHIWQILEGKDKIIVSAIEAADKVDEGDIWMQTEVVFEGHELSDEINHKISESHIYLMDDIISNYDGIDPRKQVGEATYYPKRTPEDSKINLNKTVAEQFDLLRVADPNRYPAFFELGGYKYKIKLEKIKNGK